MPRSCSCMRTASRTLTLSEKTLVWHLYQAAIAGRDIYYDQRHRHNLGDAATCSKQILTHPAGVAGRDAGRADALHQAVLDQHRPVQQPDRAQVPAQSDRRRADRSGGDRAGQRRRLRAGGPANRSPSASSSCAPHVLRSRLRADGHVQDARRGPGHPRVERRTISTTASPWPTSRASSERTRSTRGWSRRDGALVEEVYKVGGLYDARSAASSATCATRSRSRRAPLARALDGADPLLRDRRRRGSRGVRHRVGPEPRFQRRHDERLHRGLHGRARHQGRVGRRGLLRQPRQDREDPRPGRARAVVRGSPADRSALSQAARAGRVGAGHRGGDRDRRLRADHADWRQPAERPAHPRGVRQQVGVAVERARGLRAVHARQLSARSSPGTRRKSSGRSGGARLPAS